jgi:hypothetical protein
MAIEIQFDPFNFALSTMLVILMVAELYFARRERRQLQSEKKWWSRIWIWLRYLLRISSKFRCD